MSDTSAQHPLLALIAAYPHMGAEDRKRLKFRAESELLVREAMKKVEGEEEWEMVNRVNSGIMQKTADKAENAARKEAASSSKAKEKGEEKEDGKNVRSGTFLQKDRTSSTS